MAATASRSEAFNITSGTKAPEKHAEKATRPTVGLKSKPHYQLNCMVNNKLRSPLAMYSLKSGLTLGQIVEPLLVAELLQSGEISKAQAAEIIGDSAR